MRKIFLLVLMLLVSLIATTQVPQGFNYQAIARDESGNPITTSINVKIAILTSESDLDVIWEEEHTVTPDSHGLFSIVIGQGTTIGGGLAGFSEIDWKEMLLYIRTKINDVKLGTTQLWSVPYSMIAGDLGGPVKNLEVMGDDETSDEALFEVKRKDGEVMFGVYNHGVRVNMPLDTLSKTRKGGFIVAGFDNVKGIVQDYLLVSPDSVRIFLKEMDETKTRKGGFAITGYNPNTKGLTNDYLNVDVDTNSTIDPSENRILWYPLKNAFLTGRVRIGTPDSVGENSFASGYESKARGKYSQALGYKAVANGSYSLSIGYMTVVSGGGGSFAIGRQDTASGWCSGAIGYMTKASGSRALAMGEYSVASGLGSFAGGHLTTASGDYATALGADTKAIGGSSLAAGAQTVSSGWVSTSMGYQTKAKGTRSLATGDNTIASGDFSASFGFFTKAKPFACVTIGHFNDTTISYSSTSIDARDPVFIVGNGNADDERSNALTVLKSGKVGIGDSSPLYFLDINTKTNLTSTSGEKNQLLRFTSYSSNIDKLLITHNRFSTGNDWTTAEYRIQKKVDATDMAYISFKSDYLEFGIGTSPQITFKNDGNIDIQNQVHLPNITASTGTSLVLDASGWIRKFSSDVSLKENITPLENSLGKILKLQGVRFTWKSDATQTQDVGFIAQDVQKVLPEMVIQDKNDGLLSVKYQNMVAVLTEAIKEQQTIIEEKEKRIESLEDRLSKIEALLELKNLK